MAIDRQQLIQRVQEIEGLSDDERAGLLQLLREQKKYGIVWEDKPEEAEQRLADELPVLTEVKERYIAGASPDAPNHILIEGDNLHALTALSYTHEGKIDVIYIDPPYNTGNKDFVYNDSFVDREDGYRHSKWLSFMNKRLQIAKRLLSDRGVIFISIDDNEQAQLKLLCDEVFGEEKFIGELIWKSRQNKDNRNVSGLSIDHEYLMCFSMSNTERVFIGEERNTSQYSNPDNDPRGPWASANMAGLLDATQRPNCHYDLIDPSTGINYGRPKMGWRYDRNTMNRLIAEDRIIFPSNQEGRPRRKVFLNEVNEVRPGFSSFIGEGVFTKSGTKDIDEIFEHRLFQYPKPKDLIKDILFQTTKLDSTILDFFAGSGTTLHATMQLNAEDGGRRQCILVTNNENGICENVTYERNRRVIQGYTTPKGVAVAGLADNSLRYYRTDFVPNDTTIRNKRRLMSLSTDMLCIKNNLYCEQDEFAGRKLNKQKMRYFTAPSNPPKAPSNPPKGGRIDGASMLVVYDEQVVDTLVDVLTEMDVKQKIMIYVFSNTSYPHTDNFEEVLSKVELCALPSAILNAYRKIIGR